MPTVCYWCYIRSCGCYAVWQQLVWMTCGSVPFYTVGVSVCCWRSCLRPPQSHVGGERGCPWLMSAWLTSSSHPPPRWNPEDSPRLSQPFWPACSVSSCPSLSFHSPSRPKRKRSLTPPQSHKRTLTVSCTRQRTSVSSADGGDFGPSCTNQVQNINKCIYYMIHMLHCLTNFKIVLHFVPEIHPESTLLLGSG